jgi:hypothetical protein
MITVSSQIVMQHTCCENINNFTNTNINACVQNSKYGCYQSKCTFYNISCPGNSVVVKSSVMIQISLRERF